MVLWKRQLKRKTKGLQKGCCIWCNPNWGLRHWLTARFVWKTSFCVFGISLLNGNRLWVHINIPLSVKPQKGISLECFLDCSVSLVYTRLWKSKSALKSAFWMYQTKMYILWTLSCILHCSILGSILGSIVYNDITLAALKKGKSFPSKPTFLVEKFWTLV